MSSGYHVRWFQEDDVDYYIKGLNEYLYDCYDEKRFKWKMVNTPFNLGFTSIAVVEHKGKPVAFNSFLPLRVKLRETSILALQGCDGFVDLEHRRMGLFQETLRFMIAELAGKGPEILMGFNFAGSAGAAKKVGSTVTCDVQTHAARMEEIKHDKVRDVEISKISIEGAQRAYDEWVKGESFLHYRRSLDYMRWRYSHPLRRTYFYGIRSGQHKGYAIVSLEFEDSETFNIFIEDYSSIFTLPGVASTLIKELETLEKINEVYLTAVVDSPYSLLAWRLGLKPDHMYTLIMKKIARVEEIGGKIYQDGLELTNISSWHITSSDVF